MEEKATVGRGEGFDIGRPTDDSISGSDNRVRLASSTFVAEGSCVGIRVQDGRIAGGRWKFTSSPAYEVYNSLNINTDPGPWLLQEGFKWSAGNSSFSVVSVSPQFLLVSTPAGEVEVPASSVWIVGRSESATLTIPDRELSRQHFAVLHSSQHENPSMVATGYHLVDLASTNGTYMPPRTPSHSLLAPGSAFSVGRTGFRCHRFHHGGSEDIGLRRTMEDTVIVQESLGDTGILALTEFSAVCDGHGGGECSEYLRNHLTSHVVKELKNVERLLKSELSNTSSSADKVTLAVRAALTNAFLNCDKEFLSQESCPQSGSTCASVLLLNRRLFAANVGDSRVVLSRKSGEAMEMTTDQKPTRADEAARIRRAGGFVLHKRVMGELAVSRAFGDRNFKKGVAEMLEDDGLEGGESDSDNGKDLTKPLVVAEPEIEEVMLDPDSDEFILIACDGLFDVFTSQEAVSFARERLIQLRGNPAAVAGALSAEAIQGRRSRDNVSILIIILRPFWLGLTGNEPGLDRNGMQEGEGKSDGEGKDSLDMDVEENDMGEGKTEYKF